MNKEKFKESELILNSDGSVYHLKLRGEHVADTVLLVGDQNRVAMISKYFDSVEFQTQNREFITHTGYIGKTRLTVLSTGIGTDNIDIVVNELDAAINIDPDSRTKKEELKSLNLIRIGTSGALQEDIPVGSPVISSYGLGFDGLLHFYNYSPEEETKALQQEILDHLQWNPLLSQPYLVKASTPLFKQIGRGMFEGITATASGFYGPQGRQLRLKASRENINEQLNTFRSEKHRITNFEMETSALFGLGSLLGHQCATCCAIVANRMRKEYAKDHHAPIESLIKTVLERIS